MFSRNKLFHFIWPITSRIMSSSRSPRFRFFNNNLPDFDGNIIHLSPNKDGILADNVKSLLYKKSIELLDYLEKNYNPITSKDDISVYTGSIGHAILFLKISEKHVSPDSRKQYLQKAYDIIQMIFNKNHKIRIRVPTFMCGEIGLYTMAILIYKKLNKDYQPFLKEMISIQSSICDQRSDVPDEILYGRSGYLYSLLLIRSEIPESQQMITDVLIREVITAILNSGIRTATNIKSKQPLAYFWYNDPYVGAAHGYAGILYILLESIQYLEQKELETLIKPTIDFILNIQFPSGNFPACLGENEDKLVHWCHGSPGLIYLLTKAYSIFNDEKYLNSALKAGENIWQRGLLRKGYGLCHGVSGNGYSFLKLYQITKDPKHLYRAWKFAEWCLDYGKHGCQTPDTPYSMFEGMAGTVYFLLDFMEPSQARFPAFQLS